MPTNVVLDARPYFRLGRQPEATRRTYARMFDIPLAELGLKPETGVRAAGVENARSGGSGA